MQVLPVIVPHIKTTSNLALSCDALHNWLSNNGFAIKTSKGDICPGNLSLYKLLDYPDLDRWTINKFYVAIVNNNRDYLLSLLRGGANIEAQNYAGDTALIRAAGGGKIDCLQLLLQHKANVDAKNNHGQTALIWAAVTNKTECIKILVEAGAQIDPYLREKYPLNKYVQTILAIN